MVTHGQLAQEFQSALEHIVGKQDAIATISIDPADDVESRRDDIINAVAQVDSGNGVIIITDMFGGTPSNLGISMLKPDRIEVIAGANLPMLIKIASLRDSASLAETVKQALDSGRKYINSASQLLDA